MRRLPSTRALTAAGAGAAAVLLVAVPALADGDGHHGSFTSRNWDARYADQGYQDVTCQAHPMPGAPGSAITLPEAWDGWAGGDAENIAVVLKLEDGAEDEHAFAGTGPSTVYASSTGAPVTDMMVCKGEPAGAVDDSTDAEGSEEGSDATDEADATEELGDDVDTEGAEDTDASEEAEDADVADEAEDTDGPAVETDGPAGTTSNAMMIGSGLLVVAGLGAAGYAGLRRERATR